ncbi:hypothetical protein NUACC26_075360 [Scytonema sp. NUACC26]
MVYTQDLPHPNPPLSKGRELEIRFFLGKGTRNPIFPWKGKGTGNQISPLSKGGLRGVNSA